MRVRRLAWRHVPAGAEPLHLGWMQRARGRWNTQRPRIACLSLAYTQEGAPGEFARLAASEVGHGRRPRDLVSVEVDVEPVLDLTDAGVLAQLGIAPERLVEASYVACHAAVRRATVGSGFRAIKAPSATVPGQVNLVIYPERGAGRLRLANGPHRLPVNHGPAPLLA